MAQQRSARPTARKAPSHEKRDLTLPVLAVTAVATALAVGCMWTEPVATTGPTSSSAGGTHDGVPIWDWAPGRPFATEAVLFGRPVVIRNSVVTQWPAMTKWTVPYLSNRIKKEAGAGECTLLAC
jgi:hypothetical protein